MGTRKTLYFTAPYSVEVRTEPVPEPAPSEVRVRTTCSAVSPGTELLVYRGQVPVDEGEEALDPISGHVNYPQPYGYSAVGLVDALGHDVDAGWRGRRVFGFQPHTSHFCCAPEQLIPLPDTVDDRDAVFIPNVETAVSLVMDGRPTIGERVLVLGQGVVGLLTTALLGRFPLEVLVTTDLRAARRAQSLDLGADRALDPSQASTDRTLREVLRMTDATTSPGGSGADLLFELTGEPATLNDAVRWAGFESRIVVGSWYGDKRAEIDLGGRFHRRRIRVASSQVSTIASARRGRWDKARRMKTVMSWIKKLRPSRMITSNASVDQAGEVFDQLDKAAQDSIQVIFTYRENDD